MSQGPAPLLPASASDLSRIADTLRDCLSYEIEKCPDASYFVGSSTESNEAFVEFLQRGLKIATDEKQLQDTVFSALHSHPSVEIMEESKKKESSESNMRESREEKIERMAAEQEHRNFVHGIKERILSKVPFMAPLVDPIFNHFVPVAERDTKNLLDLYAEKFIADACLGSTKMKEAAPGLFIKTSSRPDIVALIRNVKDILFAQIKNDDRYSNEDAVEQQICYLMLLLYWWRVICNRNVESVCGFTICGPRCRSNIVRKRKWFNLIGEQDEKMYHISFIEVSVPSLLGQLNTAKIWQKVYNVSDQTGLVSFLHV